MDYRRLIDVSLLYSAVAARWSSAEMHGVVYPSWRLCCAVLCDAGGRSDVCVMILRWPGLRVHGPALGRLRSPALSAYV